MSCWVVPSLAAEYLGMSIDQVMEKIAKGVLPSHNDHGFTVVDVAPNGPRSEPPRKVQFPHAPPKPMHESQLPQAVERITGDIERDVFGDFRKARIDTARLRKAPSMHG